MRSCLLLALVCFAATAAVRPTASRLRLKMCSTRVRAPLAQQHGYEQQQQQQYIQVEHDFQAEQAGDLALRSGDIVQVLQQAEPGGWWQGLLGGQIGWFPSNFCSEPYYSRSRPAQDEYEEAQQDQYQQDQYQQDQYQQDLYQQTQQQQHGQQYPEPHQQFQQFQQFQQGQGGWGQIQQATSAQMAFPPLLQHDVYNPRSTTQTYE
jgi:hypothetical protein